MDEKFKQFIKTYDLSSRNCDKLDSNVAKLEDDFKSSTLSKEKHSSRLLWTCLAVESLRLKNIRLLATSLRKLDLAPFERLLRTVVRPEVDASYDLLYAYIANYLNEPDDLFRPSTDTKPRLDSQIIEYISDENIRFFVSSNDWTEAIKYYESLVDDIAINETHKQILMSQIFHEYAQQLEWDDDFQSSLTYFEKCGTEIIHAPRLIIKQYMETSYGHLQRYCNDRSLRRFWSLFRNLLVEQVYCTNQLILDEPVINTEVTDGKQEMRLSEILHARLINSYKPSDWFDTRKTNIEISKLSQSLSRRDFSRLVNSVIQMRDPIKVSNMYLLLDQPEAFLNASFGFVDDLTRLDLANKYGDNYDSATCIIRRMTSKKNKKMDLYTTEDLLPSNLRILFQAYAKIGLMDEALQTLSLHEFEDFDMELADLIKKLERFQPDSADIDPRLSDTTLSNYRKLMHANETLITDSTTIIIYLLGVFVAKLEPVIVENQVEDNIKLENMFKYAAEVLNEFTFSYSESLLNSTNVLILRVKDKLELISDNETIRDSFRQIVETIASRCMIESRYKSATMLYSQIEDHVKAVKSLMRTGEIDTVINYSLLVQDVTVNRITINYLKHLQVEAHIIEDFIKQSNNGS